MADISKFNAVRDGVRGQFTLNKMHTTTGDFFRIDVAHMVPCVPKDVMSLNIHTFIDAAPNPFPINGSMKYGLYAFFVPYRLLWSQWKNYMTDLADVTQPYFTLEDLWDIFHDEENPWFDYRQEVMLYISNIRNLGALVPFLSMTDKADIPANWLNRKFNAYALRAINKIWWDWFRDKAHISDAAEGSYVYTQGGHISKTELIQLCTPKYRCYPKNYITTAFDAPQEGGASLNAVQVGKDVNSALASIPGRRVYPAVNPAGGVDGQLLAPNEQQYMMDGGTSIAENANIGQFDVSSLKLANSIQNYRERLLVAGKTVLSRMLALFGTSPTIEELQMSNCLGGHEENFFFKNNLVPNASDNNTGQSLVSSPFGYDPGKSTVAGQKSMNMQSPDNGFGLENITYKTDETGFLVVLGCITPVVQYYQALPRDWFRGTSTFAKDRTDYFHSDFENQPLQVMQNIEVLADPDIDPDGAYGFNQNYIDYKLEFDTIAGDFCLNHGSAIYDKMHLGRDLKELINDGSEHPEENLNPEYLTASDLKDRVLFDQKFTLPNPNGTFEDHFIINHKIEVLANRPMMEVTLPSLDSAISQTAKKKLVETGGFRY